jgi:hypothetical protein
VIEMLTKCTQTTTKQDTIACYCIQDILNAMVE